MLTGCLSSINHRLIVNILGELLSHNFITHLLYYDQLDITCGSTEANISLTETAECSSRILPFCVLLNKTKCGDHF